MIRWTTSLGSAIGAGVRSVSSARSESDPGAELSSLGLSAGCESDWSESGGDDGWIVGGTDGSNGGTD